MKKFLENNEMIEVLNQRYATKKFKKTDIDNSNLEEIVTSILQLTPTSFGLQAYKFFVVKNKEIRDELRKNSWDQPQVTDSDMYVVFTVPTDFNESYIEKHMNNLQKVRWIDDEKKEGVKNFMVNKIIENGKELWITNYEEWLSKQAYIALWNAMTALSVLGIDTCAIEWLNPKEYNKILKLDEKNLTAKVALAIWKRDEDDKYQDMEKVRFDKNEIIEIV